MTQHKQWPEAQSQAACTHRHNDSQIREGFRLLGKADVQAIFGISIRCLEKWIKQGLVPPPTCVGGRRYWHPETFYAELTRLVPPQGPVRTSAYAWPQASQRTQGPAVTGGHAVGTPSAEDERLTDLDQQPGSRAARPPRKSVGASKSRAPTSTKLDDIKRNLKLLD